MRRRFKFILHVGIPSIYPTKKKSGRLNIITACAVTNIFSANFFCLYSQNKVGKNSTGKISCYTVINFSLTKIDVMVAKSEFLKTAYLPYIDT